MIELLRNRRSIRKYTNQKVEPEKIEILREALLRSPTSRNRNAWKFWIVEDEKTLTKLADAKKSGSKLIAGAPLAIVIGADSTKTDVWVEDCSIASIIAQLTAQSLGLGSCWIQIRLRESLEKSSETYVKELLGCDESIVIESIISTGYADEEKAPIAKESLTKGAIVSLS